MAERDILQPQEPPRDILGQAPELSWTEVGKQAIQNVPESGQQFFMDMWNAVSHPIDTGATLAKVASGAARLMVPGGAHPTEDMARAVGDFFADRYGTVRGFKQAVATDPVGVMADISSVFTGGGMAAARAPGIVGKAGRIAQQAGRVTDPLVVAGKVAQPIMARAVAPVGRAIGGALTGTGGEPIRQAVKAGAEGSEGLKGFREGIEMTLDWDKVVAQTQGALGNIRKARSDAYKTAKASWGESTSPLNFDPIVESLFKVLDVGTFEGKKIRPSVTKVTDQISGAIGEWQLLDPSTYHTPLGLDALKQKIGDLRNGIPFEDSASRMVVNEVYHAIKNQIVEQAPEYGKAMKDYETASKHLEDLKTLVKEKKGGVNVDATVRALSSSMRNNINTNFGKRAQGVQSLEAAGARNLQKKLAGAAMSSPMPRGIAGGTAPLALITAGMGVATGEVPWWALSGLAATSPRLVGEAAVRGGQVYRAGSKAADLAARSGLTAPPARLGAFQTGRLEEQLRMKGPR